MRIHVARLGLIALALLVVMAIPGCAGTFQPLPTASEASTPVAKAQQAINEANAALTALNQAILSAYKAGSVGLDDAKRYARASVEAGQKVDAAQQAVRVGDDGAAGQAEAARSLAVGLYTQLRPLLAKEAGK